jgi:hypothetical protein
MATVTSIATKSYFELTVETKMIYDLLKTFEFDQFISYKELSELIGRDVQKEGRHNLDSARRKCLNENHMNFAAVQGKGVKRVTDSDLIVGGNALIRIKGIADKRRKQLHAVDYPALPTRELQTAHNAELSALGVVRHFSKESVVKKLMEPAKLTELPVGKTLALFNK